MAERFWAKVDKRGPDDCWEWNGATTNYGYGTFKSPYGCTAHRASWGLHFGDIPVGQFVCHRCDNPRCANPAHLFLGIYLDNIADRDAKGRAAKGERNGHAKHTAHIVRSIRNASGTQREIAERFGTSRGYVSDIKLRKRWGHISE